MSLQVGKPAPQFSLQAVEDGDFKTLGPEDFRGRWLVLLFYPLDFTFVCPTELCAFSDRIEDFRGLNAAVCGVSVDSHYTHLAWTQKPRNEGGVRGIRFPLLSDLSRKAGLAYGVLNEDGIALRALVVIDPDGIVQHATVNNLAVGRSVDETLRMIQACQLTRQSGDVCPADWRPGEETITPDAYGARRYFASRRNSKTSEPAGV
jgi:peroxiredoxin (alkyl hydroperoxide reductase subunit C)